MFMKKCAQAFICVMLMGSLSGCASRQKVETTSSADQTIDISNFKVSIPKNTYVYDGKAKTPKVTVKSEDNDVLTLNKDYQVTYTNNIMVGTADIAVKGIKNYKGTIHKTFNIVKSLKSVDQASLNNVLNETIAFDSGDSGSSQKVIQAAADVLQYVANINLAKADSKKLTQAVKAWYNTLSDSQKTTLSNNLDSIMDSADGILTHFSDYQDSLDDAGVLDQAKATVKIKHVKDDWKTLKKLLSAYTK